MTEAETPQPDARLAFFSGLLGYLEDRSWALGKVRTSPYGSTLFDTRVHHRLYLQSLLSAVDHVRDFLRNNTEAVVRFDAVLTNGNDNFVYTRELRNAVLHRGLELVGAAHSHGSALWVICPRDVKNQRGTKVFQPPFKYFRQLADYCEQVCNPAFTAVLTELDLFNPANHIVSKDHLVAFIRNNSDIPEAVKEGAIAGVQGLAPEVHERIAMDRIAQIRQHLNLSPETVTPPPGI
jgi:hypothetical protein